MNAVDVYADTTAAVEISNATMLEVYDCVFTSGMSDPQPIIDVLGEPSSISGCGNKGNGLFPDDETYGSLYATCRPCVYDANIVVLINDLSSLKTALNRTLPSTGGTLCVFVNGSPDNQSEINICDSPLVIPTGMDLSIVNTEVTQIQCRNFTIFEVSEGASLTLGSAEDEPISIITGDVGIDL